MASGRPPRRINPNFLKNAQGIAGAISHESVSNQTLLKERIKRGRGTGQLNLNEMELTEVPEELLTILDGASLGENEKWWHMVDITSISLRENLIDCICERFEVFAEHLEILDLTGNKISNLPNCIFHMEQLRTLQLARNQIEHLPDQFDSLANTLQVLDLSENQISALPNSFGRLSSLEFVNLSRNQLRRLPAVLGMCSKLIRLIASHNLICTIGENVFESMPNLETLELQHNHLEEFPNGLEMLCACKVLDLQYNKLQNSARLPPNLDQCLLGFNRIPSVEGLHLQNLKQLTALILCDNKISAIPESLFACKELKVLDVANNDLNSLPVGIGYLEHLNVIKLNGNPLKTIRRALVEGGAVKLKKYLQSRGEAPKVLASKVTLEEEAEEHLVVQAIREAAGNTVLKLSNSESLWCNGIPNRLNQALADESFTESISLVDFSGNAIGAFPFATNGVSKYWPHLNCLKLENNSLTTLPIVQMSQMFSSVSVLLLAKNKLTSVGLSSPSPALAYAFDKLVELDLSNNSLNKFPEVVSHCPCLEVLKLGQNQLRCSNADPNGSQALAPLARLRELDLSGNRLQIVPESIWGLACLELVNLENNDISAIPPELSLLPSIRSVLINGNPQRTVRISVVLQGGSAVVAYLASRVPQGTTIEALVSSLSIGASQHGFSSHGSNGTMHHPSPACCAQGQPNNVQQSHQPNIPSQPNLPQQSIHGQEFQQPPVPSQPSHHLQPHYWQQQPHAPSQPNHQQQPSYRQQYQQSHAPSQPNHQQQPHYGQQPAHVQSQYSRQQQDYESHPDANQTSNQFDYFSQTSQQGHQNSDQFRNMNETSALYSREVSIPVGSNNQGVSDLHSQGDLTSLLASIQRLENELDSPSITQSRRLIVKKELARTRAAANRISKANPSLATFG